MAFGASASAAIVLNAPTELTPGQRWELRAKRLNVEYWTVRFNYETFTVAGPKLSIALTMPGLEEDELAEVGKTGTGQAGTGQADTGQPETGQAETGQPGTEQTDTGQARTGLTETGQPGTEQADTGQARTGLTETGQAETGQEETGQARTGQTDTRQPGTGQTGPYNIISTKRIPLEIEATLKSGKTDTVTREIAYGTARAALIAEWIASIQLDDGAERKSGAASSPGQCKHYLATMFAAASAKYELTDAPGITLYMPERPNDAKSGRVEGSAWVLPLLGTGNPFVEVSAYDFDKGRTIRENKQAARTILEGVQPGDVVQMMAVYNNGARGTHTLMVTAPYDPMKDMLYWCDSNLKNRLVDGVRYGIVMAYQTRTLEEVIGWLANPLCAATVYRLVDGIGLRAEY
jgi:hypothetical protein